MATTFTGLRVQDTYNAILKIGDNSNLSGTAKILSDGVGNSSSIYLSTTRFGIGITPAYQFHTSGNAKIGGDVIISGDLTVNGDLTYLNVTDLQVEDPLIKLAKDNTSNTLDIGFFGKYVESATTKYTGLFWDASTDKFRLYEGLQVEPTTTVDVTGTGYTRSLLNADLEGNVTGTVSSLSNHDTNDLVEGSVNLYYTNARADARVNLQTGVNLDLSNKDTDDLSEGTTNLYFTTARARASFSAGDGITITNGVIASEGDAEVAKRIDVTVKNVSGGSLAKGVVVHAAPTATPPSGNIIEVIPADANVVASMPAIGVLNETIANEAEGEAVMFGAVSGIDTSSFSTGDELYVSETAGEFTATKPTAFSSQVQKIAVVIKSHASNGLIKVFGAGRSNDIPNRVDRDMNFTDDSELTFGDSSDLKIYHTTNNIIRINSGDLIFNSFVEDGDIKFQLDNGIGSPTEYMRLDGGEQKVIFARSPWLTDNLRLYFGNDTTNDGNIYWDSTASQLFISGESKFLNDAYVVGNLGIGTAVADSPLHISKGGLNTTGQDYGVHIGVLESGAARYSAIEIVSNGALSGWIDFSNTDSANDYNERIRGGDGTLRFFSNNEEAVYINSNQHTNFIEDIIVTSNDHNLSTIEFNENSTHFGRLHYFHSDFTTSGTNIADGVLLVASSESTGGIVLRSDKAGSEIVFAIGNSDAENIVMKITDGANGVEFFPTSTAEGGHIALRADTNGSYRYAIDNYNDTMRIVRQADADATGGVVVASVDENGDFSVTRNFIAGRTGYFTSNPADSRVLYLDQYATDTGNIVQFRDQSENFVWELVGRNNQFYIYNNGLSRQSLYINPTNNFIGINGNVAPKAFLHVTDGTNSYPTDSNNKLVVESTGHTYIGLGGGDNSDVGIHFGDSTAVNRGRLAYIHSDDSMRISTNGAVRYILDGYGNVGYNSTIKQSNGTWRNFQFGSLRMFGRANDSNPDGGIGTNFYFTTANAELRASAHAASRIWFNDDQINFDNAGTGTIDSAITWNNRMFINASGYLGVGATTAIAQLHVDAKDTPYDDANGLAIFQDNGDRQIVIGGLGIFRRDEDGNADLRINYLGYNGGVTQPRDLDIYDGKGNRIARFDGSTKSLGIGTDTPSEKFVVGTTGGTQNIEISNNYIQSFNRSASAGYQNLNFYASSYTFNVGNLGIGSSNPGRGLTIDKGNQYAALEIIKNNTGNQIVYLGTGSSGTGENSILQLKDGTVEKIRMYSTGTSWITGGNLVIGNTSSTYDFEVFGTDAKMFVHYNSHSRGGIAAFSSQRIAMTTTSINDNLVFGYGTSTSASADFVERMRIDNGTGLVTAEESLQVKEAIRVFGNNVSDISATNSPTTTSVNLSTYNNEYSFIDLASSNANGSWIDFSNANGTDYSGRIRYNFTSNYMKFYAGSAEQVNIGANETVIYNRLFASEASYAAIIGQASFSWAGSTAYPTIYGSNADRWVMFTFPHIACLQNGVNGHTGSTTGAKIRFASNPAASASWDAGVDLQYNASDRFSIARGGAIMINCLPPSSTWSGISARDWTIFGSGSRAGGIVINDIAGANYGIYGGGYDLTFGKSVNGTSVQPALAILGDNASDTTPDVKVYNDLTVDGTAYVGNAATVISNSASRVLYLKQNGINAGNIVQFQDHVSNNVWEVVGRNNTFYIYNNMNSQGYAFYINPNNNYIGIDKSSAGYNLDVSGTIRATSDVIAFSDKRVKENIVTVDNALDKVTKLRGVTYTRKDTDDKSTKVGVIAQEVLKVLPEVVEKDHEGMYSVAYGNMAGVFIEAIKQLKAEVDSLKQEIKELKK